MKCWSCQADNDLGNTQTCTGCGAPLVRGSGVFRKSALLVTLLALVAFQLLCVFGRLLR